MKRDTYKYQFKDGRRIVHRGITNDPERRETEHQSDYDLPRGHLTIIGNRTTEKAALKWEREGGKS